MVPAQYFHGAGLAGEPHADRGRDAVSRNPLIFGLVLFAEIWLAHAFIFFAHEYSHSFLAWICGFKADPLRLHFGSWSFWNLLAMIEIDENVDYVPIFTSGHGTMAALIAVAGPLSAAPLYVLSLFGYRAAAHRTVVKMFWFLACLMCVGNFIDYVPIRTFAPIDDMYLVEKGVGLGPWAVLICLGVPFLIGVLHFLVRLLPDARRNLFRRSPGRQIALVVVSTFLLFVFFGAAGLESGTGAIAHWLSRLSVFGAFPIATLALWPRKAKPASGLPLGVNQRR